MEEIENGIRIRHQWLNRVQTIDFEFQDGRLLVSVDPDANSNTEVLLAEDETAFVLAWMAAWYERRE